MKGKERCKILKDIRRQIAESNDIEFVTSECKHKGDCLGTCPKCEEELRYLEQELEKRQRLGKTVVIAGLAVSISASMVGCDRFTTAGVMMPDTETDSNIVELMGDVVISDFFEGEIISVPSIDEITPENAMDLLKYLSREMVQAEWNSYSIIENGQAKGVDLYLTEKDTLLRLEYDESNVLVYVELIYGYRTTWER